MRTGKQRALILLTAAVVSANCGGGGGTPPRATPAPAVSTPAGAGEFERDLASVRRARLSHTYIISRKDGAALDPSDREFIARHTPMETSQRLVTDAGRRAIIGTNFDIYPESKEALEKRFIIEKDAGGGG